MKQCGFSFINELVANPVDDLLGSPNRFDTGKGHALYDKVVTAGSQIDGKGDTHKLEKYGCKHHHKWSDGPAIRRRGPSGDKRPKGSTEFVFLGLKRIELVVETWMVDNRLEEGWFSGEHAQTCQTDNIQCGATHVDGDVQFDGVCVSLVQLGEPDIPYFGSLLVEDWHKGLELRGTKGWVLWESVE